MDSDTDISVKLQAVMQADRHRILKLWRQAEQAAPGPSAELRKKISHLIERSRQRCDERRSCVPDIQLPPELPISEHAEVITDTIRSSRVVVLCGETGSGKSTQLPKLCLQAGRGIHGMIGHTQPRRLAARSLSSRIADELGSPLGGAVGFKIRFTDHTAPTTLVKLMTDGILLAETQSDRFLDQYDTIIVDEAHERSLNIDFLMGYLRRLLDRRKDLKVILTSATLDADKFANHFDLDGQPAPIIKVAGRTYPVELRYRPLLTEDVNEESNNTERDLLSGIVEGVHELHAAGPGDILIFLPTEAEIRAATKRLRSSLAGQLHRQELDILPLYARLSNKDQNRVFQPGGRRRIVLATNVAESSITVPGIRYVIDAGTARISRYAPRTKVQRLPIEPISRASADQRAGRCGRLGPGICLRLYSETDYEARDQYSTPEIRRTNLASVILQTEALKLGKIAEFPFLDPPRPEAIRDGYKTLYELGAVDSFHRLTDLGRELSRLPVDPRVGRMILAARELSCLADVLILASGLEIQDPRERPAEKQQAADEQHAKFSDPQSDFMSLLKIWDFYHELKSKLSQSQLRKACLQNFLSYNRLREWADLHRQLHAISQSAKMRVGPRSDNYDAIHRALLTGLLSGVAYRTDKFEYTGAGGLKFHLWPGSGLFEHRPEWLLVNEIVETTRRYGRTAAKIQSDWIEPIADHLVKRHVSDGHWHRKSHRPMAYERVTLFGLPVVVKRRIPLGPRDPEQARKIFIDEGLVQENYTGQIAPLEQNQKLLESLSDQVAKNRDPNRVVDPYQIVQLYDDRLPPHVYDGGTLRKAIKADPSLSNRLLFDEADFFPEIQGQEAGEFPNSMDLGAMHLPLDYVFEPGSEDDGVTLTVPVESLNQISSRQLGWLVPGLMKQRIIALIRSLPKPLRRQLVPAPDTAEKVLQQLKFGDGDFYESVAKLLGQVAFEKIEAGDFNLNKISDHLHMNLRVVDADANVVATGRDLDQLRTLCGVTSTGYTSIDHQDWQRDGILQWDFEEFPKSISFQRNQLEVIAYPAILDHGDSVGLKLVDLPETADSLSRIGLTRLAWLRCRKSIRSQVKWLPDRETWLLRAGGIVATDAFENDLGMLLARLAFVDHQKIPRCTDDWENRFKNATEQIGIATQKAMRVLPKLFENYHQVRLLLENQKLDETTPTGHDVRRQLTHLFPTHFLFQTPWQWLQHVPRYLQAMQVRLQKLSGGQAKDLELVQLLEPYEIQFATRLEKQQLDGIVDPALTEFGWMLQEYRVSLWAQQLGTASKVSPQRLEKLWSKTLD